MSPELHQKLGIAYQKSGMKEKAKEAYEKAIALAPSDPWSYMYLGNVLEEYKISDEILDQ